MITTTPDVAGARVALPVTGDQRIVVLDVIRGFAVLGILLMNIVPFSGGEMFNLGDPSQLPGARFDGAVAFLLELLVHAKFYSLFSLLFGIGFAIFLDRASARDAAPTRLFRRRLVGLLIIGAIHTTLIWFGDILNVYALLGFLLIPFRRLSDRTVLRWAVGCLAAPIVIYGAALIVAAIAGVRPVPAAGGAGSLPPFLVDAIRAFAGGTYADVVRGNIVFTVAGWLRRIVTMFALRMFGMFLLGLWAARAGIFRDPARHAQLLRRAAIAGLAFGGPASLIGAALGDPGVQFIPDLPGFIWTIALSIGSTGLCIFYAAGLTLLFQKPAWRSRLLILAPVGSMALSNYLFQSVVAIPIFYGLGLGLFSRVSLIVAIAIALGIYATQTLLTRVWQKYAAYGPVEWIWRQFTYGRRFPLLRQGAA